MKLLLFILGITLCTASPSFRAIRQTKIIHHSDLSDLLISPDDEDIDRAPRWLLEGTFRSEEEDLSPVGEEPNTEETLPEEEEQDLLSEIREDDEANAVFEFGFAKIISEGIQKSKIPNVEFIVSTVSYFTKSPSPTATTYKFNAEAASKDGSSVINMNFTVNDNAKTQQKNVTYYSYIIKTTTVKPTKPTEDKYVELTPAQISGDTEAQATLAFGVEQIIKRGNEKGKIPVSDYEITKITSAARLRKGNKNYYKFNVELEDANKVLVQAQFVVSIRPTTQDMALTSWFYQASNIKFSIDESAYIEVKKSDIKSNTNLMDCLKYAIKDVVKKSEQYTKIHIKDVYVQALKGIVYYKYDVELNNRKDKTVKLIATVAYNPLTHVMDVKAYEITTTVTPRK